MLKATIIAALALSAAPASVAAQTPAPPSVRVHTADLDLSHEAGVTALDRRVKAAVREVCPYPATADLATLMSHRACARAAHRSAADGRDAVIASSRLKALQVRTAAR